MIVYAMGFRNWGLLFALYLSWISLLLLLPPDTFKILPSWYLFSWYSGDWQPLKLKLMQNVLLLTVVVHDEGNFEIF